MKTKTTWKIRVLLPVWVILGLLIWNSCSGENTDTYEDIEPTEDDWLEAEWEWDILSEHEKAISCELTGGFRDDDYLFSMMTEGQNKVTPGVAAAKIKLLRWNC